ncbi:MAG TPA: hypothetical protein QGF58_14120 [Myxococcota bacterium]|nr:hypothetical protein [Myxococcota bacterium]
MTTTGPISRKDLETRLSAVEPARLAAVLEASDVRIGAASSGEDLAAKLVRALWWRTHSPVGLFVMTDSLDDLVANTAARLDLPLPEGDAFVKLEALTEHLVPAGKPIRVSELDSETVDRLESAQWTSWVGVSATGGAAGTKVAADAIVRLFKGPIGDILPYLPKIGPIAIAVKNGAKVVSKVAGPLGIGFGVLTVNDVLGADYDEALPLLLGAGLCLRDGDVEVILQDDVEEEVVVAQEVVGDEVVEEVVEEEIVEDDVTIDEEVVAEE